MEFLSQHVEGEQGMPGRDRTPPWIIHVLLNTGSGVTWILEELLVRMQRATMETQLAVPFKGIVRFQTVFGEEHAVEQQAVRYC